VPAEGQRPSTRDGLPRASLGVLTRRARATLATVWAASPSLMVAQALLAVAGGVSPAATAWLSRSVLNALVPGGSGGQRAVARLVPGGPAGTPAAGPGQAHHVAGGNHILLLAAALGVAGLVSAVLPYVRRYSDQELKRKLGVHIQDRLFAAINSFAGLRRFETPQFIDQIRLAEQSSKTAPTQLVSAAFTSGQSLITVAGFIATLEVINPLLTAIVLATVGPSVAAELMMSRRRAGLQWRASPFMRRQFFYSRLLSEDRAVKEVRIFGLGDFLRGRMLRELHAVHRAEREVDRRAIGAQSALGLLAAGITAVGLIWTVRQAAAGRLSIGDVPMFMMAAIGVQSGLSSLATKASDAYEALLVFGHYLDVVSAGPDLPVAAWPRPLPALRDGIEVRDVWFRYDTEHPWALQGVSLFIPYGKSVALVGLNGAGKSTLVKLLCRLYDPDTGTVLWDGADIRDVAPEALRGRIGAVFQDYMTYDLTAAENIGIGDLGRLGDRERVRRAAEQAGVHDRVSQLPRGYDTLLSRVYFDSKDKDNPNTGVVLSGGQWQRLALARGLMRADRDLLILDEPSAGLDAEAEHAIHQRLVAMREGRTSLLISHRLGSVRDADVIYVLAGGRIIEQGTHQQLMAAGGEYRRLFALQASGYADSGPGAAAVDGQKDRLHGQGAAAMLRDRNGALPGMPGSQRTGGR
jgi:ATP-binding cassette, subfamily B, bacterial